MEVGQLSNRSALTYLAGFGFFSPVLAVDFFAGGGWLDKYEVFFIPFIISSLILFSLSYFWLEASVWFKTILNVSMVLTEMLSVPNITWPVGSEWYESIELGFGLLGLMLMLFNGSMFFLYKSLIIKRHEIVTDWPED